ncbi:glycosyl hydrolase [Croceiramulus getboli]|nr:glycosyl hydrolase [Flavobacteriaceae bacterium YJPT1-3]
MQRFYSLTSLLFFSCAVLFSGAPFAKAYAQQPATSASQVQAGLEQKAAMVEASLVKHLPLENIGPSVMSGRVVDIDVNPEMTSEFYVGYASGGLWYTNNNGTTFEPVLDAAATQNVGDIAVDWKNNIIWVGTGENNSSRSSYAGIGMLKSTDGGEHWEFKGLPDSHHIGRILLNPNNPNEVVVGVTGHLYSPNSERGVYRSMDGGDTWERTLFVNEDTGIIDMAYVPGNFNIQYAAAWEKDRKAWNFEGSGEGSGVYKSTDAGKTWNRLSNFPQGEGVGRIGLAVYDENTVYVVHDSQFRREEGEPQSDKMGLVKEDFKNMSIEAFLALDNKKLNAFLKENNFQEKYRAENVKNMVRKGGVLPVDLAKYLEDANALLFDTPVIGAEVYRSDDGGQSWAKTHEGYLDDIYYSYGYYFGQIQVNPNNADHIYISGVPILKSKDGGQTFENISARNVHSDHHSLWINPKNPDHLINGNDGGVNITYDDGAHWIKANQPSVGQFYAIAVDQEEPYNVYGGLQDNGVWVGAHNAPEDEGWHSSGQYPWESIMGGDGMQVQVDNRNADIVYTGFQFGNYFRLNRATGERAYIQPKHELGEAPYRFNWQTPILLSPHNQDILYLGGNKLMRSMNQGDDWTAISGDLTQGGKKGNVAYGTLTTISESPFQFGLIYTGSDDGLVHVTRNAGGNWQNVSASFPKDLWVSRVIASQHEEGRVYVTLNGYRWDDFKPYVYVSEDYGNSWKDISANLPVSPVNVIREDPENAELLYLGTDNGAYVSLDRGDSWQVFDNGLPAVAVHDLVVQQREADLLVGTHGRSIYKADLEALQQLDTKKELQLFDLDKVRYSVRWGTSWGSWGEPYEPEVTIPVYSNASGSLTLQIVGKDQVVIHEHTLDVDRGMNFIAYPLVVDKKQKRKVEKAYGVVLEPKQNDLLYIPEGDYTVKITRGAATATMALVVE